jgi:hypothetical protein
MISMLQRRYEGLGGARWIEVVAAVKSHPDVLLLDLSLPGEWLDLIPELRRAAPNAAIVVVTMHRFVIRNGPGPWRGRIHAEGLGSRSCRGHH